MQLAMLSPLRTAYARNYLLPRGFAVTWTQGGEKQVRVHPRRSCGSRQASLEEAQALAASLAAKPVVVAHKAGADGRLFGTVKADAIAEGY